MRKIVCLFVVLLVACAPCEEGLSPTDDAGTDASSAHKSSTENDGSVWVCHNPDSEWHGHICNEECYWVGFERSENSYCWLLRRKDCQEPLELEWQRENCHLLKEEHDCD